MLVRAPGKLVLSGAYAVLSGAPAVVTAVDRFVVADAARPAERVTPEVRAALGDAVAPWFSADELREGDQKLGLGSSAAILVASLAARVVLERGPLVEPELGRSVLAAALAAHAAAQGGGSGVDVAASALGGTLLYRRAAPDGASRHGTAPETAPPAGPSVEPVVLPAGLVLEAWWSGAAAVTSELVGRVAALGSREPGTHARLLGAQTEAALAAAQALRDGDDAAFIRSLVAQGRALRALGEAAGAPIVTLAARELGEAAERDGGAVLPAGAGGGDIVVYFGPRASSAEVRAVAARHRHRLLSLAVGARGAHVWPDG